MECDETRQIFLKETDMTLISYIAEISLGNKMLKDHLNYLSNKNKILNQNMDKLTTILANDMKKKDQKCYI